RRPSSPATTSWTASARRTACPARRCRRSPCPPCPPGRRPGAARRTRRLSPTCRPSWPAPRTTKRRRSWAAAAWATSSRRAAACLYTHQVALGLQHAADKGMAHRDIKPQNLILTRDGNKPVVKVLDFGLAKVRSEKGVEAELTGEGKMLGTPHYIAPEQILD